MKIPISSALNPHFTIMSMYACMYVCMRARVPRDESTHFICAESHATIMHICIYVRVHACMDLKHNLNKHTATITVPRDENINFLHAESPMSQSCMYVCMHVCMHARVPRDENIDFIRAESRGDGALGDHEHIDQ
jgi:hypothetical protein